MLISCKLPLSSLCRRLSLSTPRLEPHKLLDCRPRRQKALTWVKLDMDTPFFPETTPPVATKPSTWPGGVGKDHVNLDASDVGM